ncbi:MAG: Phosphomannomutase/phosphoglucomutase [Phycisphaerae bacterium]|nr:Phosphomannomutase/phosphoglucomutase [Phycisphaerae bacterium]
MSEYVRYCPGDEHIRISDSVCFGRRRVGYPKCRGCQFNDDEKAHSDRLRILAPGLVVKEVNSTMVDKVFKAYDVRGIYPDPLNEELAWRIGFAAGTYLRATLRGVDRSEPDINRVVVGRDMRKSSPSMSSALIQGLRHAGAGVINIGMIDTSQIYFAVNHLKCCGGIQTTASHNPAQYIGFKICGSGGKPIGEDTGLNEIREITRNTQPHEATHIGSLQELDLANEYRAFVLKYLDRVRPLRLVIDASNGMAGHWIPLIFDGVRELQIDPINFEHNGEFVHDPNPLVAANLAQLRDRVVATKADLGICFDGDADRCMLVDEKGQIIPCDLLTALLSEYFLRKQPRAAVVYDLRSSRIVAETVRRLEGTPHRSRVGHAFMKKTLAETRAVFGGELSGHFYFQDNWYCDSGILAMVHSINVLARSETTFSQLIAPYRKFFSSGEINFANEEKDQTIRRLGEIFHDAKVDFLDGITIQYPDWWFNVRKSNTEPLLRLNMEAVSATLLEQKIQLVARELGHQVDH